MDVNQIIKFPPREAILVHFIYKKGLEERININKWLKKNPPENGQYNIFLHMMLSLFL